MIQVKAVGCRLLLGPSRMAPPWSPPWGPAGTCVGRASLSAWHFGIRVGPGTLTTLHHMSRWTGDLRAAARRGAGKKDGGGPFRATNGAQCITAPTASGAPSTSASANADWKTACANRFGAQGGFAVRAAGQAGRARLGTTARTWLYEGRPPPSLGTALWRSGVSSWKGRGPSAVASTPLGAVPKYHDPGQQGNDLSRSRGDWIRSEARLFPSGFPAPLLLVWTFRFGGIYRFGAFGVATLATDVRVWEGFIESGDAVPVAVW